MDKRRELVIVLNKILWRKRKHQMRKLLYSYRYCLFRIDSNDDDLVMLQSLAEKTTTSFSQTGGGGSGNGQRMENAADRIMDLRRAIERDTARLKDYRAYVEFLISTLDNYRQREVLVLRYLQGKRWDDIAEQLHYEDARWVRRMHDRAIGILTCNDHKLTLKSPL